MPPVGGAAVAGEPGAATWAASVVIPAHDEEAVIATCLEALARQDVGSRIEVVVAANGCSDGTVEIARSFTDRLPGLRVIDLEKASKVGALNAGDRACTVFPRLYLDADIALSPTVVGELLTVLDRPEPALAGPTIVFDTVGASATVRRFYRAYARTPYVMNTLVGLGAYALNAAGRARFEEFPELTADDLFVQRLFGRHERHNVPGQFTVRVPRTLRDLVRVRTRTASGNVELAQTRQTGVPSTRRTVTSLLATAGRDPALLPSVVVYVLVVLTARNRARRGGAGTWWRDESTRSTGGESRQPPVAYLVSQYPAPSHAFIEREVAAVRALGQDVEVFSVRTTPRELLLSDGMRSAAATTVVLQDVSAVARAVLRLVVRHPAAVGRAVRRSTSLGAPGARSRLWQLFYLAEAIHLLVHLRKSDIWHVHAHFANNAADIARAAVLLARDTDPSRPWSWTFTMHGPTEFENVDHFDLPAKVASAGAVACITDFARSQLMRLSPPESWDRLHVVPMSVDLSRFRPTARERVDGAPLRVLFVGRLVPEKGPSILLQALAALRGSGTEVEAVLAGAGPLADALQRDVQRRGLGASVRLPGALGQDDLVDLYAWADVFCLPSFQEGLPVVLMEALATGLPVVTTPIAGIPELVRHDVTGVLVSPGRSDLVTLALAELAEDPARRRRLGSAGREAVAATHSTEWAGRRQVEFLDVVRRR